jgi:anti-sigma factor RsiW
MTEWIKESVRHIPEEELHAYFDQALSRSQCAEIETHLSHCAKCQAQRAEVAILRDRTTAMLAQLSPRPVIVPPSFQVLLDRRSRQLRFAMWRVRFERAGLWAAGIAAAAGIGWLGRTVLDPHRTARASAPIAEVRPPANPASNVVAVTVPAEPGPDLRKAKPAPIPEPEPNTPGGGGRRSSGPSAAAPSIQPAASVLDLGIAPAESATVRGTAEEGGDFFSRIWRVVQWDEAIRTLQGGLPYIEGLTVVGVQMRPGSRGERPTVIVTQQDASGELIHSIEGPVAQVNEVLHRQPGDFHSSEPTRTPHDYVEDPSGGFRRTLRVLTIFGKLPVDSLNALMRLATIR